MATSDHSASLPLANDLSAEAQLRLILLIALGITGGVSLGVFLRSLPLPLTDLHGFRQTQTAASVYWMLHGGPWLDYLTPVLGAPWSVPFEFPLFQWIVALTVRVTGLPIDPAGRMVSFLWLLAGWWPAASLIRSYRLPPATLPLFAILMLGAPVYLFWGRAFLMETQAVTLGLAHLALFRVWSEGRRAAPAILAALAGAACILTKVTTALPFFCLAALILADRLNRDRGRLGRQAITAMASGLIMLPALLLFGWWTGHADAIKAAGPLTAHFQAHSPEMTAWNFGTLDQRFSLPMVGALLRSLMDVAGLIAPFALFLIWLGYRAARPDVPQARSIIMVLVAAYLLPFAAFANLHIVHDYYQAGNAIFLLAALAVALAVLSRTVPLRTLALVLAALMGSQYQRFVLAFVPVIRAPQSEDEYHLATTIRAITRSDAILLIAGRNWSAVTPYYAERRAVMLPDMLDAVIVRQALDDLPRLLAGAHLGAAILCPRKVDDDTPHVSEDPAVAAALDRIIANMHEQPSIAGCRLYTP